MSNIYAITLTILFVLFVMIHSVIFTEPDMKFIEGAVKYQGLWVIYFIVAHLLSKKVLREFLRKL